MYINRLVRKHLDDHYYVYIEGGFIFEDNEHLEEVSKESLNTIKANTIFDELIIIKGLAKESESFVQFFRDGLIKSEIFKNELFINELEQKKCVLGKDEFDDLLNWGFWDVFNYEVKKTFVLKYQHFIKAYTFFTVPQKPVFGALLDDYFYLFINNSYT